MLTSPLRCRAYRYLGPSSVTNQREHNHKRFHDYIHYACRILAVIGGVVALSTLSSEYARAQDSCSTANFSVSPCVQAETHVSAGGTATFNVYNYGYADDTYYVFRRCSGIVTGCTGGGYYYAAAYGSVDVNIGYTISTQSGQGVAGADISSTYLGGDAEVAETVYGQPALVIDSAQTPVYGVDQQAGRCAVSCFTATASLSTVPFYTLGQARNVTLVYNEERAHPKPFIYAMVSPAADAPAVSKYYFSATLNGAAVTFTNGEQTLQFLAPGNVPVRLGGQIPLSGSWDPKSLIVTVMVQYASGSTTTLSYATKLVVNDASGSVVARGWSIANVSTLVCDASATWQGCIVYGGDASLEYFAGAFPSYNASDHTTLSWNPGVGRYERRFLDGSIDQYESSNGRQTAHVDAVGRISSYVYDSSARLIQIIDPRRAAGAAVPYLQLGYDASGNLHTITEQGGPGPARVTTVTVDGNRNLTSMTDPDGYSTNVYYNPDNTLYAVKDRRGSNTYYGYGPGSTGLLTSVQAPAIPVDAGGGTTTSQTPITYFTPWQSIGVPTTATASSPPYATQMSDVVAVVQAPGNRISQFAVNHWGAPATSIDPLDKWMFVAYDGVNPSRTIHPNGERDTTVYDAYDRPVMSQSAGDSATYYHYNAASQVDSVWGKNVVATYYTYNADRTLASTRSASGVSASFTYNTNKQVVTATDNAGHQTTYNYDWLFANPNSVTLPGGRTTTVAMNAVGLDSVVTAPTLAAVTTLYDVMNRPTQVIPAGRPATVLTYDALFRTDVTDANGNVTHTDFNALGMPTARRDASGVTETYRYDIAGRKTSWTNRRGTTMTYAYDPADRLTSRVGGNISDGYSYSDDPYWGNVSVASNTVETDSLFHAPAIEGHGGADSTVTWLNGVRYRTVRPQAGALSVPLTMGIVASGGPGVQFTARSLTRDATTGLATSLQDGFNTVGVQYDAENQPTVISNMSGVNRYPNYTALHTPSWVSFSTSTLNTQFGRSYHYDLAGRIDMVGSPYAGTQQVFHYDQYGQLSGVDNQAGCSSSAPFDANSGYALSCGSTTSSTSFTYDNVGNRTDLGATYYAGNRLALFSSGWYTYDADGNVNQKYLVQPYGHNQQFYWNPENRLDSLRIDGYYLVQYKYNAFGKPVLKYRQGTLDAVWLWDGDAWLAEFNGSNQRVSEYQYAGVDQPFASVVGTTTATGIHHTEQDALGNVLGTHAGGTVTETISYDPWGMPSYTGDLSSRTMWKGLMWEGGPSTGDVVGLYYMRGRWYDPQAGRFIQEDPLGVDGSINLYGFAGDDPVNGMDPSGMSMQISCTTYRIWHYNMDTGDQIGDDDIETFCYPVGGGDGAGGGGGSSANRPSDRSPTCSLVKPTGNYLSPPDVDPRFQPATAAMLSRAIATLNRDGITPVITGGYRPPEVQAELRASASPLVLTPARVSWHQVGEAVDFGPNSNAGHLIAIRGAMIGAGFVWGGTFRHPSPDPRHYQSQPAGTSPSPSLIQACARASRG